MAEIGLPGKAQHFGVEAQRLLLVVHVDAGQLDLHCCSLLKPRSVRLPFVLSPSSSLRTGLSKDWFSVSYRDLPGGFLACFATLPGQQTGHGPGPRYLCPRLHVFQPPRLGVSMTASMKICRVLLARR